MVKPKQRKGRLDKGGGTAGGNGGAATFIGFGSFAAAPSQPTNTAANATTSSSNKNGTSKHPYVWSPTYTAPPPTPTTTPQSSAPSSSPIDDTTAILTRLFPRIFQKRDAVTLCKALAELKRLFSGEDDHDSRPKRHQAGAVPHWAWIYSHVVAHDPNPSVRAAAVDVWVAAYQRVPKMVQGVLSVGHGPRNEDDSTTPTTVSRAAAPQPQQGDLLGILWATRTDPAPEVRLAASSSLSSSFWRDPSLDWEAGVLSYTHRILSYGRPTALHQALAPKQQPQQQQQRNKGGGGGGGGKNNNNNSGTDAEQQRVQQQLQQDVMEERFERMVGNCLDALQLWMQEHHGGNSKSGSKEDNGDDHSSSFFSNRITAQHTAVWYKTLSSPKPTLRRKTYLLLQTMAQLSTTTTTDSSTATVVPSHWLPNKLPSLVAHTLSSEKDANNLPVLLETLLALLLAIPNTTEATTTTTADLATAIQAPVAKIYRKACYGAPVRDWCPTLLPLVAQCWNRATTTTAEWPVALVRAAWEGRTLVLADAFGVCDAVCETAVWGLLLRQQQQQQSRGGVVDDHAATALAQLWCDAAAWALSSTSSSHRGSRSHSGEQRSTGHTATLQSLARQLVQLDTAVTQRPTCAMARIAPWFWETAVSLTNENDKDSDNSDTKGGAATPAALAVFVRALTDSTPHHVVRLLPTLRARLRTLVRPHQASTGAIPPVEVYECLRAVVAGYGPAHVFDNDNDHTDSATGGSLEHFILNDLMRWTILHTTTLVAENGQRRSQQSVEAVRADFGLLAVCLGPMVEKRTALWNSFVRELVVAKCDVRLLNVGLDALKSTALPMDSVIPQETTTSCWLSCPSLDKFVFHVGTAEGEDFQRDHTGISVEQPGDKDDAEPSARVDYIYEARLKFLQLCLALDTTPCLVGATVLSQFAERIAGMDSTTSNPLLVETLLQAIQQKRLSQEDRVDRILLRSWRCSTNTLFERFAFDLLHSNSDLRQRFLSSAASDLRQSVNDFASTSGEPSTHQTITSTWALQAWRLVSLRDSVGSKEGDRPLELGVESIQAWRDAPAAIFELTMSLFQHIHQPLDRLSLVKRWSDSEFTEYVVEILVAISEASSDVLEAARTRFRLDRCSIFLAAVGGKELDHDLLDKLYRQSVTLLKKKLESPESTSCCDIQRRVASLSQLVGMALEPLDPNPLVAENVMEGDRVWYITDANERSITEEAVVAKVHFDSQAGYYFAIRIDRDGAPVERQTVAQRLRKDKPSTSSVNGVPMDAITEKEWAQRLPVCETIMGEILNPHHTKIASFPALGELLSMVVSQVGVGKGRGVGTLHYEIHRIATFLEAQVLQHDKVSDEMAQTLQALATSQGFGWNMPGSKVTSAQLRLNPLPLTTKLLDIYSELKVGTDSQLDVACVAWLCVSLENLLEYKTEAEPILIRALTLIFQISSHIFVTEKEFTGPSLLACRATYEATVASATISSFLDVDFLDAYLSSRSSCLEQIISTFTNEWKTEDEPSLDPRWETFSHFPNLICSMQTNDSVKALIADSVTTAHLDSLALSFRQPEKRYYAFILVEAVAKKGKIMQHDDVAIGADTTRRLVSWMEGLHEEEAAQVEEDVYIVAEWVPLQMMNDIERWEDDGFDDVGEATVAGRFLTWLALLLFIDTAAPQDHRNRPAFLSYLSKSGAVGTILSLAVVHDHHMENTKGKASFDSLDIDGFLKRRCTFNVSMLASMLIYRTMQVLPSLSRRWWEEECPKVYTSPVKAFVEGCVAPDILQKDLKRIKSASEFGSMVVTASIVSRQVTATYVQDDFTLTVLITLPASFPLRSAQVDCSKTLGVSQSRWKHWSLQITLMLNGQGGTLLDALLLWKNNVDKEFEGVEPCPVCYSVLHVKTYKLPSLECKTCHNRFHVGCLTEWFRSSGKNQCVICQQPWQGSRIG